MTQLTELLMSAPGTQDKLLRHNILRSTLFALMQRGHTQRPSGFYFTARISTALLHPGSSGTAQPPGVDGDYVGLGNPIGNGNRIWYDEQC